MSKTKLLDGVKRLLIRENFSLLRWLPLCTLLQEVSMRIFYQKAINLPF